MSLVLTEKDLEKFKDICNKKFVNGSSVFQIREKAEIVLSFEREIIFPHLDKIGVE